MDRIACMIGENFLYWNSVILTLGAATAICFFLAFYYSRECSSSTSAAVAVPLAMVLGLILARLAHWYFQPDSYPGFIAAMTDYTSGGYALMGGFAGCLLTALLLRLLRLEQNLRHLLDAMSLGGCAGIAVGRLACLYSSADRGQVLANFRSLPWAYPVPNAVTGAMEYRLATFMIQAMAAAAIFVVLVLFYLLVRKKDGETALLFFLLYGMSQAVLDSTRYDSLFMRSNGFIGVAQLLGALSMVIVCAVYGVRLVKARGFHPIYLLAWIAMLGCLGGAGYMEYYIQRHGNLGVFCYSIMTACLTGMVLLALLTYRAGFPRHRFLRK